MEILLYCPKNMRLSENKMAKGPFMEFLRAKVTQVTANVYAEAQIPCPTSKTENMAMLIHSIELRPSMKIDSVPTDTDTVNLHLTKASKTTLANLLDPDVITDYKSVTILGAVMNDVLEFGQELATFDPPILYPRTNLYLGIYTVGLTTVISAYARIGYTLEKVSREDFISALVE